MPRSGLALGSIADFNTAERTISSTRVTDPSWACQQARTDPAFQAELQAEGLRVQKFGEVQGFYYTKGKPITLTLYGTDTSALERGDSSDNSEDD